MLTRWLMAVVVLGLSAQALSVVDVYEFGSEVDRERYQAFVEEMRCPKCQNQNLADSNSPIASDLRRELHRLIDDGKSDKEVVDFMVARYGEFVLYNPQLKKNTWLLWFGPASMLLVGAIVIVMVLRKRTGSGGEAVVAADESHLSRDEAQRLEAILGDTGEVAAQQNQGAGESAPPKSNPDRNLSE